MTSGNRIDNLCILCSIIYVKRLIFFSAKESFQMLWWSCYAIWRKFLNHDLVLISKISSIQNNMMWLQTNFKCNLSNWHLYNGYGKMNHTSDRISHILRLTNDPNQLLLFEKCVIRAYINESIRNNIILDWYFELGSIVNVKQ